MLIVLTPEQEAERLRKKEEKLDRILAIVKEEVLFASNKFKPYNSPHEGYGVIWEEYDELGDEVRGIGGGTGRDYAAAVEAKQLACVSIRYIMDLINDEDIRLPDRNKKSVVVTDASPV